MMRFLKKLAARQKDLYGGDGVTVAFLGDSVTQGCFECYVDGGRIETVFDTEQSYSAKFKHLLQTLYPRAQINIVNSGISGDSAPRGLERLEKDILRYHPDLTVVSFGLNDCGKGLDGLPLYLEALRKIFTRLAESGSEVVFLSPCMTDTFVSGSIVETELREIAKAQAERENNGTVERYFAAASALADSLGVRVCDCYSQWKRMNTCGVDTTALLANGINHPIRELHWLIAYLLIQTVFSE